VLAGFASQDRGLLVYFGPGCPFADVRCYRDVEEEAAD
jgi:hypothetical protein